MAEPVEARSENSQTSVPPRQSRLFWATTALCIAAMLLLCTALILIAATRASIPAIPLCCGDGAKSDRMLRLESGRLRSQMTSTEAEDLSKLPPRGAADNTEEAHR